MGEARIGSRWLPGAVAAWLACGAPAGAQSRFLSYETVAECVGGHLLEGPLCRSAFANAEAEFTAKTKAFGSQADCAKAYGDCAPWPIGAKTHEFRPRWRGVDIVDTPREKTVTPSPVPGARRVSFAPQPLTEFRSLDVRLPKPPSVGAPRARTRLASPGRPTPEPSSGPSAPPPPGSGFTLEDGVLTYPAPARFQPKTLRKQP